MRERELEADNPSIDDETDRQRDNPFNGLEFLGRLNVTLHEMSQPMTVLLCALEYGGCLQTVEELKQTLTLSQEQCERLQKSVLNMQLELREAIAEAKKGHTED